MSAGLPALAVEILELITAFLQPADLRSLRLACQNLHKKTLYSFGVTNFTTIYSDLSRTSLQRLQSISEREHLAGHVQCLHINLTEHGSLGLGFDWPRHPSGALKEDCEGTNLLRDILSQKLLKTKCRSFHIDSYDEYEPPPETDCIIPSDAVGILQSIISQAVIPLKSFVIQSNHTGNGRLDTPRLRIPLCQERTFIESWAVIQELILSYAITSPQFDWVLHLISSTTHLRKLSLKLYEESTSFIRRLNDSHKLGQLEDLSLTSTSVTEASLLALLQGNRDTLHSLSLAHVTIDDGGKWVTVLASMKDQLPRLHNLSLFWLRQDINDTRGRIGFTDMTRYPSIPGSQEGGGPAGRFRYDSHLVDSVSQPVRLRYWGGKRKVVGVEYKGKQMNAVLVALADTVEMLP